MPNVKVPKISIIIPTRERADTLEYTLKTCVSQEDEDIEILVSDNASNDNTKEIVEKFTDSRISYYRTDKRISMASNWEFALSKVRGEYIHILGDDDGLVPGAIRDIKNILSKYEYPAFIWQKAEYTWPGHIDCPNYLNVPLSCFFIEIESKIILKYFLRGWVSYARLPVIYSGVISRSYLEKIRAKNGKIINSSTPDVYLGFALLSVINKYLYSTRPLSVNGGSHHSNGASSNRSGKESVQNMFFSEMDIPYHKLMSIIPGSLTSSVFEALLQANEHCFNDSLTLNIKKAIRTVVQEISTKDKKTYSAGIKVLAQLYVGTYLADYVDKIIARHPCLDIEYSFYLNMTGTACKNRLILDASTVGIKNIYDCCNYLSKVIKPLEVLPTINRLSLYTLFTTWIKRRTGYMCRSAAFD